MHYNWQILVQADDAQEAKDNAEEVLNQIDTDNTAGIWDWFEIGGRWNDKKAGNVVNATSKTFWTRLKEAEASQQRSMEYAIKALKGALREKKLTLEQWLFNPKLNHTDGRGMIGYHITTIANYRNANYQSESYLATDGETWGSAEVPEEVKQKIKADPERYWLVNVDIHN